MTQTGVQILLGVLIVAVFQPVFAGLSDTDRALYVVAVTLGAAAAGALIGPVALHRMVAGYRIKPQAVTLASRMAKTGLVLLAATMILTLLLLLRLALDDTTAWWLTAVVSTWLVTLWLALPVWARRHYTQ